MANHENMTPSSSDDSVGTSKPSKPSMGNAGKAGDVPVTYQPESGQPPDRNPKANQERTTKDDI